MKISRYIPRIVEHAKTAFWLWVGYSVLWVPFWGLAWLIKLTGDPTALEIYQWVLYAGYPALGLVYAVAGVLGAAMYAVIGLCSLTMPWGLYAAPFIALGAYIYFRVLRPARYVPSQADQMQALSRSAPLNLLDRPYPGRSGR